MKELSSTLANMICDVNIDLENLQKEIENRPKNHIDTLRIQLTEDTFLSIIYYMEYKDNKVIKFIVTSIFIIENNEETANRVIFEKYGIDKDFIENTIKQILEDKGLILENVIEFNVDVFENSDFIIDNVVEFNAEAFSN